VQALSNHVHIIATDVRGELPGFMAWFDREVAKCLNEHYDRAEALWSSDHYSAVALIDAESVVGKLVYLYVNVVKAGLVRTYRDWPGVTSAPRDWLRSPSSATRPELHFDQDDERWAEVEARFTVPPALRDRDVERLVRSIEARVADQERVLREIARREGRAFRGADRCVKQDPFSAPDTKHVKGRLNPTFAAGTAEGQKRAREMLRHFRSAYRDALEKFRRKAPCVFPAGTYWLVRLADVCCAPLSTARPVLDST
jgi:putative transposase